MSGFAWAVVIWSIVLLFLYSYFFAAIELHKEAFDDEILLQQVIFMDIGAFVAYIGGIAAIKFVSNKISPKEQKRGKIRRVSDEQRRLLEGAD